MDSESLAAVPMDATEETRDAVVNKTAAIASTDATEEVERGVDGDGSPPSENAAIRDASRAIEDNVAAQAQGAPVVDSQVVDVGREEDLGDASVEPVDVARDRGAGGVGANDASGYDGRADGDGDTTLPNPEQELNGIVAEGVEAKDVTAKDDDAGAVVVTEEAAVVDQEVGSPNVEVLSDAIVVVATAGLEATVVETGDSSAPSETVEAVSSEPAAEGASVEVVADAVVEPVAAAAAASKPSTSRSVTFQSGGVELLTEAEVATTGVDARVQDATDDVSKVHDVEQPPVMSVQETAAVMVQEPEETSMPPPQGPTEVDKNLGLRKKFRMNIRTAVSKMRRSSMASSSDASTTGKTLATAHYGTSFAGFQATTDVKDGTSIAHLPVNIMLSDKPSIASPHVMAPVDRNSLMGRRLTASKDATVLIAAASSSTAQALSALAPSGTAGVLVDKGRRSSKSFIQVVAMLQSRRGTMMGGQQPPQQHHQHQGAKGDLSSRASSISEIEEESEQPRRGIRDWAVAFIRQNRRENGNYNIDYFGNVPSNREMEERWGALMREERAARQPGSSRAVVEDSAPPMPITKVSVTNRALPSRTRPQSSAAAEIDQGFFSDLSNLPVFSRQPEVERINGGPSAVVNINDQSVNDEEEIRPMPTRPVTQSSIPVPLNPKFRKVEIVPVSLSLDPAPQPMATLQGDPAIREFKRENNVYTARNDVIDGAEALPSTEGVTFREPVGQDVGPNHLHDMSRIPVKPKTAPETGRKQGPAKRVSLTAPSTAEKSRRLASRLRRKPNSASSPPSKATVLTKNGLELETRKMSSKTRAGDEVTGVLSSHMSRAQTAVQHTNHIVTKGPTLPFLESRPITNSLKRRFNEWDNPLRRRADDFFSQNSKPLPIKRDSHPPQKMPSRRDFLIRELRSRREMLLQEAYLGPTAVPPRHFLKHMVGLEHSVGGLIGGKGLQTLAPTFNTNVPSHEVFAELGQVHWMERIGTRMKGAHVMVATAESPIPPPPQQHPPPPPPSITVSPVPYPHGVANFGASVVSNHDGFKNPNALPASQKRIRRSRQRHEFDSSRLLDDYLPEERRPVFRGKYEHPQLVLDVSQA